MTHIRCTVSLQLDSGVAEDRPTNTFHFDVTTLAEPYSDIATALEAFYENIWPGFPSLMADSGHSITMYNMTDPTPRAPVWESTFTSTGWGATGDPLPSEVALCLSFQGARVSGQAQARRRGRVYLGPYNTASNSSGRPGSGYINAACEGAATFLTASDAAVDWTWVVYSTVDDELVPIVSGWVDNAWDIQRRRGLAATSRQLWSS